MHPHLARWLPLSGAILCEVTGSLSLKAALDTPWLYALVAAGYATSFALLALTLRQGMPLGVAYGIWGAIGLSLTAIASWLLFSEPLTPLMILGLVLIAVGVLCVELGSNLAARRQEAEA